MSASVPSQKVAVPVLLLAGVLLVATTMRAPIIAVAPVVHDVRTGLHIGAGTAGLLTTIPVLCFGLGTPLVLAVVARAGIERAVLIGLAGTLLGVVIRSVGGVVLALLGTLIIGLAITVGNVVIPVIIGRDFPGRAASVTAAYSSALNLGSMAATTISAPVADAVGWRVSLAGWGLLVIAAAILWRLAMLRHVPTPVPAPADDPPDGPPGNELPANRPADLPAARSLWRRRLVVGMTVAFAAQSFSYYAVSAWLPSLLADELHVSASRAGASSSIFQVVAIAGAFAVAAMAARAVPARIIMLAVCSAWFALAVGLALAPSMWVLWCVLGGLAQGGGFTTIFSVLVSRATDSRDSRRMSAAVQGGGYCLGATGPFIIGAVHSLSGGWTVPMSVVAGVIVAMATSGWIAIGAPTAGRR